MSLWWCLIYPWLFCNLQWLRPAGLYERCKLALELERLKNPAIGGINCGSHTYFLTTQGHGGPPGWVLSTMPGPPPRQHKHERRYTPSTQPFILTRQIWKDDYDGQMMFRDLVGLTLPDICLTGEEKPRKTSPRKLVPTWNRTRCVTGAHATACSTVVDYFHFINILY